MKLIFYIVPAMLFCCSVAAQDALDRVLHAYIDTALKNNPDLQAWQYQSDAMEQRVRPARALEDPMVYGGVMNLPTNFSFRQDMMTMKQIGVQQNFSVGRKYTLKGRVAEGEYQSGRYEVEAQRLDLAYRVKELYYDLYAQVKAIETTESSIEVMKTYIGIAHTRYSTGKGTQQDVLKAQVELTRMEEELIKMKSMKDNMEVAFNTLLNRNRMAQVLLPEKVDYRPVDGGMDSYYAAAEENSPVLMQARTQLSTDSAAWQLEKTMTTPDFNAGFWYGQRQALMPDGNKAGDMIGIMFGLTLPLYSGVKQKPLAASSKITVQQSQARVEAARNEVTLMIHHAMVEAEKNKKLIVLYEQQLIPQATENLHSGFIGYQEDKIDFMTLTDNFLSLYHYRLQVHQSVADYYKALAELDRLTGKI